MAIEQEAENVDGMFDGVRSDDVVVLGLPADQLDQRPTVENEVKLFNARKIHTWCIVVFAPEIGSRKVVDDLNSMPLVLRNTWIEAGNDLQPDSGHVDERS